MKGIEKVNKKVKEDEKIVVIAVREKEWDDYNKEKNKILVDEKRITRIKK